MKTHTFPTTCTVCGCAGMATITDTINNWLPGHKMKHEDPRSLRPQPSHQTRKNKAGQEDQPMTPEEMIRRGYEAFKTEHLRPPQELFDKLVERGTIDSQDNVLPSNQKNPPQ